ncbi:universal stress protein [Nocardioides bruguierae]|uniref:Universal stress protein n=1 Tax=Nocardioides bruguierae TaxID=2945102 RepID=A0A9X2D7N8_9ACTN|nr:universal stress protein [Nocardioides bruguierae]MCM0619589.1 universal stress protein [Nocardioides bruguierae]
MEQRTSEGAADCGRVVVAVSGSRGSAHALAWALRAAEVSGRELEVVTVWPGQGEVLVGEAPGHYSLPRHLAARAQARALAEATAARAGAVPVRRVLANGRVADVLVDASDGADVLVLGTHRSASAAGAPERGVAAAVLPRVACAVVEVDPTGAARVRGEVARADRGRRGPFTLAHPAVAPMGGVPPRA